MRIIVLTAAMAGIIVPRPVFAAEQFDVIRPGDAEMSCQALASEINDLSRKTTKQRERAAKRTGNRGSLRGLFGVLAPVAVPVLSEFSAQNGGAVGTAAESAGYAVQNAATAPTNDQRPAEVAPPSLEQQRLDRLTRINTGKPC